MDGANIEIREECGALTGNDMPQTRRGSFVDPFWEVLLPSERKEGRRRKQLNVYGVKHHQESCPHS